MKANELRIGNFYDHNGFVNEVTPNTIEEVWIAERSCVKPIPLTEEWLLKFGFEKGIEYKTKFNFLRFHLFQINASNAYNNNFNEFSVTVYQFKQNIEICRLKYVHQLQNLYFALTGEELTINQ